MVSQYCFMGSNIHILLQNIHILLRKMYINTKNPKWSDNGALHYHYVRSNLHILLQKIYTFTTKIPKWSENYVSQHCYMGFNIPIFYAKYTHFAAENIHIFPPKILSEVRMGLYNITMFGQTYTFCCRKCTHEYHPNFTFKNPKYSENGALQYYCVKSNIHILLQNIK